MTSDAQPVYVWTWLPGATEPVVAGRLDRRGGTVTFTYGRSYLARPEAISLYLPELPLQTGPITPSVGEIAGCISDAGPDAWGRRVIMNRLALSADADPDILTLLLESGSDRIGALDFQTSPSVYTPRLGGSADLAELMDASERVERGEVLPAALHQALLHGSSLGGARPKAALADGDRRLLAKFSSATDPYPVVKAEFIAMELAARCGLNVAPVEFRRVHGRDVLLVERFDRPAGGGRRPMVSALTILGLDEVSSRYASYADLADAIRARFTHPQETLRELFSRIVFNILTSNTDDHARNHAAFWDGHQLTLTPAYDICPQPRAGGEATQVMAIGPDGWRYSQIAGCVRRAVHYLLTASEAQEIADRQVDTIIREWDAVCDAAALGTAERAAFWKRQFLNPYSFQSG